jgi:hypothetical protein
VEESLFAVSALSSDILNQHVSPSNSGPRSVTFTRTYLPRSSDAGHFSALSQAGIESLVFTLWFLAIDASAFQTESSSGRMSPPFRETI